MKNIILILIVLLPGICGAQVTVERSVIASVGAVETGSGTKADWTAGEAVIHTLANGTSSLSQGFHQNLDISVGIDEHTLQIVMDAYPNPVADKLWVDVQQQTAGVLLLTITDMNGKLLQQYKSEGAMRVRHSFDMEGYAAGVYLLGVYQEGKSLKYIKITKG